MSALSNMRAPIRGQYELCKAFCDVRFLRNPRAISLAKQRCLDDMMEGVNPPGWESYCPNSGTIRTLM